MNNLNPTVYFSIFRMLFGILLIPQTINLNPYVHQLSESHLVLSYPVLSFIQPYSHELIDILSFIAVIGALLIAAGLFIRIGALIYLLSFGYLFLMDMSFYNNHYYLCCLLALLFIITPSNKSYSIIDILKGRKCQTSDSVLYIFRILLTIIYLYAAIVKINADWLQGYPATIWFESRGFSNPKTWGLLLSYAGLLYDSLMPVLLWTRARSWLTIIAYCSFHIINYFMFNIGIFPLLMISAYLLFMPRLASLPALFGGYKFTKTTYILFFAQILYLLANVLFPLRFLFVPGRTSVHRQGYYFSWRMMLDNYRLIDFYYTVKIPDKNLEYRVDFSKLMTFRQFENTYNDPYAIWLVAQKLKEDVSIKHGDCSAKIFCSSLVALNQNSPKFVVDSDFDLATAQYKLLHKNAFISYK